MQFSPVELWQAMGLLAKSVVVILMSMSLLSFAVAVEKWLFLSRAAHESARFLRSWREQVAAQGYLAAMAVACRQADFALQFVTYRRTGRRKICTTCAMGKRRMNLRPSRSAQKDAFI